MSMVELTTQEQKLADRFKPDSVNSLALSQAGGGVTFMNAGQALDFAKMMALANSGVRKHLRGNPGACLAIVVQAVEWGMSPFAVANKSYFVNDQIAFESQLMQAVILRRAPIRGRIHFEFTGAGQDRVCRAWARLRDEDEVVDYVSPKLKDIKPKNSPLWQSDPDQQMTYSAGRALCRRHFPDVLLGVYAEDEIDMGGRPLGASHGATAQMPRGLQGKLDALAGEDERAPRDIREDVVDHDASAPANDDAQTGGTDYGPMLAELRDGFESAETLAELQAKADEAGWVKDAPEHVKLDAAAMFTEEKDRIEQQMAREAAEPDPHAELREMARKKAGAGRAAYQRWFGGKSEADRAVLDGMAQELIGIAAEADRQAGRAG